MISDKVCLILVTTTSGAEAESIAESLLKENLIACANIIPKVKSIFKWKDKIECSQEYLLLIKTKDELFQEVSKKINSLHSYEVPEIIMVPIEKGDKNYMSWVVESCKKLEK